ncbi:MAG: hypothetical protein ABI579_09220 [Candidatus Sumerlaeota bacterium]
MSATKTDRRLAFAVVALCALSSSLVVASGGGTLAITPDGKFAITRERAFQLDMVTGEVETSTTLSLDADSIAGDASYYARADSYTGVLAFPVNYSQTTVEISNRLQGAAEYNSNRKSLYFHRDYSTGFMLLYPADVALSSKGAFSLFYVDNRLYFSSNTAPEMEHPALLEDNIGRTEQMGSDPTEKLLYRVNGDNQLRVWRIANDSRSTPPSISFEGIANLPSRPSGVTALNRNGGIVLVQTSQTKTTVYSAAADASGNLPVIARITQEPLTGEGVIADNAQAILATAYEGGMRVWRFDHHANTLHQLQDRPLPGLSEMRLAFSADSRRLYVSDGASLVMVPLDDMSGKVTWMLY